MSNSTDEQLNKNGDRRGMSPNSRRNLENGRNKNGRPKDEDAISKVLREIGSTVSPYPRKSGEKEIRSYRLIACERLWNIACYGEPNHVVSAMSFITERTEGKVTQPIGGEGGRPIEVEIDAKGKLVSILNRLSTRAGEAEGDTKPNSEGS